MQGLIEAICMQDIPLRIKGIIFDDNQNSHKDTREMDDYSFNPKAGQWIHGQDVRNHEGELLTGLTYNIPSDFRTISSKTNPEFKNMRKASFENSVLEVYNQMGGDVLISDHLMMRLDSLLDANQMGVGKVLNIHPAITNPNSKFALRGKTPTQEAIDNAQRLGEFKTGGTFHFINKIIDDGPIIAEGNTTTVLPNHTAKELRYINYQKGKIPVFSEGIRHLVNQISKIHNQKNHVLSPMPQ